MCITKPYRVHARSARRSHSADRHSRSSRSIAGASSWHIQQVYGLRDESDVWNAVSCMADGDRDLVPPSIARRHGPWNTSKLRSPQADVEHLILVSILQSWSTSPMFRFRRAQCDEDRGPDFASLALLHATAKSLCHAQLWRCDAACMPGGIREHAGGRPRYLPRFSTLNASPAFSRTGQNMIYETA
jgi:hypothetical protein